MRKSNLSLKTKLRSRKKVKTQQSEINPKIKSEESNFNHSENREIMEKSIEKQGNKNKNEKLKSLEYNSEHEKSLSESPEKNDSINKNLSATFVKKIKEKVFKEDEKRKSNNFDKLNIHLIKEKKQNEYNNHMFNVIKSNKNKIVNKKINKQESFDGFDAFPIADKSNLEYEKHLNLAIPRLNSQTNEIKIPKIENFDKIKNPAFSQSNGLENNPKYKKLSKINNQKIVLLHKYSQKLNMEWFPYFDKNGVVYFYNRISGDTSFNFPKVFNHNINRYENL